MKVGEARWVWALLLVAAAVPAARGLWLDLPSSGPKCVSEELHSGAVVLADYYAFIGEDYDLNATRTPTITVKVTSPYGNDIYHQEKVRHGQFAFTATEAGSYLACFSLDGDNHEGKKVTVGIDWKIGIAAKDWDSVARKEKIEGLELELKKLEAAVDTIRKNLFNLMKRGASMRNVSEMTNARVAWFSLMAIAVCIVASSIQLLYLRVYFRRKKLI